VTLRRVILAIVSLKFCVSIAFAAALMMLPPSLPSYVKDHVVPLACGGPDSVGNLQWQTKAKDRMGAEELRPVAKESLMPRELGTR
jgi:hypothetical protein